MGFTDYPHGITSMGSPVTGGGYNFAGWWDNNVWFLDFDHGARINTGDEMEAPQKDLYMILQNCGAGDTIYVRPRTEVTSYGANNSCITPASTETANWTIARGLHHLSIIGTSRNQGLAHGVMFQSYTALATPTIDVLAPFCTLENLGVKGITEQLASGLIRASGGVPETSDGFCLTVDNCQLNVYQSDEWSGGGAVLLNSGRYNRVLNTDFWHCKIGIELSSAYKNIQGNQIINCVFHGQDTDIDADIRMGDTTHVLIDSCIFAHDVPAISGGSLLKYVKVTGTAEGVMSNCYFGSATAVKNTDLDQSSLDVIACHSSNGTSFLELPST